MKFDGPFAPGASMRGIIVPTTVDAEVAKAQKPYEGLPFEIYYRADGARTAVLFPMASGCG